MKKKILMFLISSLSIASTVGNFEITSDAGNQLVNYDNKKTDFNAEIKAELKVLGTGFSTGGNIRYNINDSSGNVNNSKLVSSGENRTKFWAKYDFPKFYGVGTSLKATVDISAMTDIQGYIDGDINDAFLYAKVIYSGDKLVTKPKVLAFLGSTYKGFKDLELSLKLYGKYDSNSQKNKQEHDTKFSGSVETNAKYTAIKDIELLTHLKWEYKNTTIDKRFITAKQSVSYTGIKNLTITGSLGNNIELANDNGTLNEKNNNTMFRFLKYTAQPEIKVEYKYAVTEDLTITPKIKAGTELGYYWGFNNFIYNLYTTPEILLTYKPVAGLTLSANVELPVAYGNTFIKSEIKKFGGLSGSSGSIGLQLTEQNSSGTNLVTVYYNGDTTKITPQATATAKGKVSVKYEW